MLVRVLLRTLLRSRRVGNQDWLQIIGFGKLLGKWYDGKIQWLEGYEDVHNKLFGI